MPTLLQVLCPPESLDRLLFCAAGICLSYLLYGMVQERLFLGQERLGAAFLIASQSASNSLMAWLWIRYSPKLSPSLPTPPPGKESDEPLDHPLILSSSLCYVVAMTASNEALNFVSYPTAVLCKSCKLLPTMLVGSWMEGTSYGWHDWTAAGLMTAGIIQFHLHQFIPDRHKRPAHNTGEDTPVGLFLLFLSLGMDGILGACQGLIKRPKPEGNPYYRAPTAIETMLYMNLYALLFLVPWSILVGQWSQAMSLLAPILFSFGFRGNTSLLWGMLALNITAAVGQLFIFWTITWYSPLLCTTITTTRKFLTIIASVFYFGHVLSSRQWMAVGMVFTGLYLCIVQEATEQSSRNQRRPPTEDKDD